MCLSLLNRGWIQGQFNFTEFSLLVLFRKVKHPRSSILHSYGLFWQQGHFTCETITDPLIAPDTTEMIRGTHSNGLKQGTRRV